jgi:hypothetical protein
LTKYKWSSISNSKSTTRTLRIPQKLDILLEKDSANKRVSVNSLVSSLITKYAEWDRYIEPLHFVTMPSDGLKFLVNSIDDEIVEKIGNQMGSNHIQEFMMLWFKKVSLETFFEGLSLFCRYSGMASFDMDKLDDKEYVVTLHHTLGRKWSLFIQSILKEGIKKTLDIFPKFEITESSIVFRFPYA